MIPEPLLYLLAGIAGGAINASAGGAKLFVFPLLLASGLPPLAANVTGAVALWPAQLPAVWVWRKALLADAPRLARQAIPAVAGGLTGALLLVHSSADAFVSLIPVLLGIAVAAIVLGPKLADLLRRALPPRGLSLITGVLLFLTGLYGGYFGAGMGFMLIAVLTAAGGLAIQQANAAKNLMAVAIATTAVVPLTLSGLVDWHAALLVLGGGLAGGYAGGHLTRMIPERPMRIGVAVIGVALTASISTSASSSTSPATTTIVIAGKCRPITRR
jgi:uncharacterized membrane protein YfcA